MRHLLQLTLQNHLPVHHCDHAIHDFCPASADQQQPDYEFCSAFQHPALGSYQFQSIKSVSISSEFFLPCFCFCFCCCCCFCCCFAFVAFAVAVAFAFANY